MLSDSQLLRCFAEERSQEAFAGLVERHVGLVYGVAMRVLSGDAHRAQEVAQTVFANLAKQARVLMHHEALVGWLHVSAHNAAVSIIRSEQRRKVREQEAHLIMQTGVTGEQQTADWSQLGPVLDEAMSRMGEADRAALLLRYFHNRSYAEIGAELDLSADASRKRTERALEKLRGLLARRGVTSTAAALGLAMANQALTAAPAGLAASVTSATLATAAVATAGSGGMTLIQFMSIAKMKAGIIGAVVVASAATIGSATLVNSALEQRRESERIQAAGADSSGARSRFEAIERQITLAQLERDAALTRASESTARLGTVAAPMAPVGVATPNMEQLTKAYQEFLASPENRIYLMEDIRNQQMQRFLAFFEECGFSVEKRSQVIDLLCRMAIEGMEVSYGILQEDPARMRRNSDELNQLLGMEGMQRFSGYQKLTNFRSGMERFALDLEDAGMPIAKTQIGEVSKALAGAALDASGQKSKLDPYNPQAVTALASGLMKRMPALSSGQCERIAVSYLESQRLVLVEARLKKEYATLNPAVGGTAKPVN